MSLVASRAVLERYEQNNDRRMEPDEVGQWRIFFESKGTDAQMVSKATRTILELIKFPHVSANGSVNREGVWRSFLQFFGKKEDPLLPVSTIDEFSFEDFSSTMVEHYLHSELVVIGGKVHVRSSLSDDILTLIEEAFAPFSFDSANIDRSRMSFSSSDQMASFLLKSVSSRLILLARYAFHSSEFCDVDVLQKVLEADATVSASAIKNWSDGLPDPTALDPTPFSKTAFASSRPQSFDVDVYDPDNKDGVALRLRPKTAQETLKMSLAKHANFLRLLDEQELARDNAYCAAVALLATATVSLACDSCCFFSHSVSPMSDLSKKWPWMPAAKLFAAGYYVVESDRTQLASLSVRINKKATSAGASFALESPLIAFVAIPTQLIGSSSELQRWLENVSKGVRVQIQLNALSCLVTVSLSEVLTKAGTLSPVLRTYKMEATCNTNG